MWLVGPWPPPFIAASHTQKSTTLQTHTHTHHIAHTFTYTHCMPFIRYFSSSLISCQESEMECYGADT